MGEWVRNKTCEVFTGDMLVVHQWNVLTLLQVSVGYKIIPRD